VRLFGRQWRLVVGDRDLSDLDLAFEITRSTHREPNPAIIQVWNLNRDTRARVEAAETVALYAGFSDPPQIFSGDVRRVFTERDGVDTVTTITGRDGGRAYADVTVSRSYAPGTPVLTVVRDTVDAMGIGRGNLADFAYSLRGTDNLADGYVAHGRASRVLNDTIRASGNRWSVQNGSLQVQQQGRPLQLRTTVLAPDSGLVGSPAWDETGKRTGGRRGLLTATALIQSGIEPGRLVRIESAEVTGDFEVRAAKYKGQTRGNDWYAALTLRRPTA
jgi:hypothetical protein